MRTVGTLLRRRAWPPPAPPSVAWGTRIDDPVMGPVRLTGRLSDVGSERLMIAVHGLGGSAGSLYLHELATSAVGAGWSILRVNLRGADRQGEDFYHGGLTADLHATLASDAVRRFQRAALVGFSLGGHTVLKAATEGLDPRVGAVATVCPPVDLAAGQRAIDRRAARIYRRYVLGHVKEIYREVAARRSVPVPVAEADLIKTLWDWDEVIVSARHGFGGAADYYQRISVAPHLDQLSVPTLLVASDSDPMVLADGLRPHVAVSRPNLTVHWSGRSGHVAFPRDLDLGYPGPTGLSGQLIGWLDAIVR